MSKNPFQISHIDEIAHLRDKTDLGRQEVAVATLRSDKSVLAERWVIFSQNEEIWNGFLDIESELNHIVRLHNVGFALGADFAGGPGG